jgi:hypothetical protein
MGIVDFITKPFSPEAILAITRHTLEKHRRGAHTTDVSNVQDHQTDEETLIQPMTLPAALSGDSSPRDGTSTDGFFARSADAPPDERRHWMKLFEGALLHGLQKRGIGLERGGVQDAVSEAVAQIPPPADMPWVPRARPALWGNLHQVPIPEVFQLMTLQGQTGLFQVWTETFAGAGQPGAPSRFDVCFSLGKVDFVHALNVREDFLLGRFLVAQGSLDKTELDGFLRARKGSDKLLGQQLVALKHVTREQLNRALRDQCSELVYELLRLQQGTFSLHKGLRPLGQMGDAGLSIPVEQLLLEGLRRVDEWGVIEKEITSFEVHLQPERNAAPVRLTDHERQVLSAVNSDKTVRQIMERCGMRPFEVSKILYRLLMAGQIRKSLP